MTNPARNVGGLLHFIQLNRLKCTLSREFAIVRQIYRERKKRTKQKKPMPINHISNFESMFQFSFDNVVSPFAQRNFQTSNCQKKRYFFYQTTKKRKNKHENKSWTHLCPSHCDASVQQQWQRKRWQRCGERISASDASHSVKTMMFGKML